MAVVAKRKEVNELLKPYKENGINPNVTVSVLNNYELYKACATKEAVMLMELNEDSISLSYIDSQQRLRLVKTINTGLKQIKNNIKEKLKLSQETVNTELKLGLFSNEKGFKEALEEQLKKIKEEIAFSVSSFKDQLLEFEDPKKIVVIWSSEIDGATNFISSEFLMAEDFPIENLKQIPNTKFNFSPKLKDVSAIAASFSIQANSFDLAEKNESSGKGFILNLSTSAILLLLLLIGLIAYRKIKLNGINSQIIESKTQVMGKLKRTLNIQEKKISGSLSQLVKRAEEIVSKEESLWYSFSKGGRYSFLRYLEELSTILNKKELDLNIIKFKINDGIIEIEGNVPSYPQLEQLEKALEDSPLFRHVTRPEQLKFTIKLTIKQNEDEE